MEKRALVREGKGTRNWSQRQQISMIRKGQVSSYQGHHMQSVKTHPRQAGNPQNIQFLNHFEHIKGAHRGNTQNSTNGFYNPETKTMHSFGSNTPQAPQIQLSNPLSQNQINSAVKREQYFQNRVSRDRAFANQWRKSNGYSPMFGRRSQPRATQAPGNKGIDSVRIRSAKSKSQMSNAQQTSQNRGIESVRQKSSAQHSSPSSNRGISSYQSRASGQVGSASPKGSVGASKGLSASSGKSAGGTAGGQSR